MKMAFLVCNTDFIDRVMKILKDAGIDYFTTWDGAKGKGRGTQPHLGVRPYPTTNSVTMIAFDSEPPLEALKEAVAATNNLIVQRSNHIRLFQLPLERVL